MTIPLERVIEIIDEEIKSLFGFLNEVVNKADDDTHDYTDYIISLRKRIEPLEAVKSRILAEAKEGK